MKFIVGQHVVIFLSVYAPQSGLSDEVKDLGSVSLNFVCLRILYVLSYANRGHQKALTSFSYKFSYALLKFLHKSTTGSRLSQI